MWWISICFIAWSQPPPSSKVGDDRAYSSRSVSRTGLGCSGLYEASYTSRRHNIANARLAPACPPTATPEASLAALTPSKYDTLVFEQPIQHTPGEGAVSAAALERQVGLD